MTTFITGGTSSIGKVLVQELSRQGEPMRVLVRQSSKRQGLELPGVEFVFGDVTDFASVQAGMAGCERVTHLAAVVGQRVPEAEWWRVNRDGTRNVLQAALEQGVSSMVQVSTLSVFGHTEPGEMADERRPIHTERYVNLYQKTKHAADEIAREYAGRGLKVKIVYPGFGFGCSEASSHTSFQDQTLLRMAAGKPLAIMGNGQNKLLLAYYNDTIAAIELAHQCGQPGEGYILGNENLSFPEIWAVIARLLGQQAPKVRVPLGLLRAVSGLKEKISGEPIFPPSFFEMVGLNWCFSNQKARQELGWQPKPFAQAMAETWQAYQVQGVT